MRSLCRTMIVLGLSIAIVGCGPREADRNLDSLDNELVAGNARDPALRGALEDQIMVDPALTQNANRNAVSPPARPYSGAVPPDDVATRKDGAASNGAATSETLKRAPAPASGGRCPQCDAARQSLTLGALAATQRDARTKGCATSLRYSARWAQRLPADLPLYPDARVSEAAGTETGTCALRAVSFSTTAPLQTVLDWYYTRATKVGFSAEHQANGADHVLGGTRTRDDGAFALFLTARKDGGTDADLVANNGR